MFKREALIPAAEEILERLPLPADLKKIKAERDRLASEVIRGETDKLLLIVGPCSAHESEPVLDYVERLGKLNEKVKDKIVIIPRIYTNKPRTKGVGYKGMFTQPDPRSKEDILKGILTIRQLHIDAIGASGLSAADEMLYPENYAYMEDLLTYIAIGARSVENQQHRLVVSGMDIPAGMKNPTSGTISIMLNSIRAAQSSHTFIYRGWEVNTDGNPLAHAILRGAQNKHDQTIPNYHYEDLKLLYDMYQEKNLRNMACIVDTNHSNSGKKYLEQIRIANEILHSMRHSSEIRSMVKGLMIESYIEDGAQKVGDGVYGKSITDPCLGWEKSEKLVLEIADQLR